MPVRPSCRYSGAWAGARTKSGLWRVDGARGDDRGHGGSVLAVGGPAGVLERCVASVCPPSRVSFCFVVVLAELRALLLQRRWLFEGNFAGLGGHAGACACPRKGIDPSCLICCLCFALA